MRKSILILLLFFTSSTLLLAGTTGKLTGKITDAKTDEPLAFVNVILLGTTLGAATDIDGNYTILNIPPGKYSVKAQYIGYRSLIVENVSISIDLTTQQDFVLAESVFPTATIPSIPSRDFTAILLTISSIFCFFAHLSIVFATILCNDS